MVRFFKQLYRLLADNRLHAVIVIVGTAVTMTFVMAVVIAANIMYADLTVNTLTDALAVALHDE